MGPIVSLGNEFLTFCHEKLTFLTLFIKKSLFSKIVSLISSRLVMGSPDLIFVLRFSKAVKTCGIRSSKSLDFFCPSLPHGHGRLC